MKKTTLRKQAPCIINPVAGKKKSGREVWEMIGSFYDSEYDIDARLTQKSGDGTRLVMEHAAGITICMKNGMGMRKTQAWAGHSTITVTERYAHWDNIEDVANSVAGSIRIFPVAVEDQQVGVSEVSPKCRQGVSKASPAFQAQLQSAPVIAQWG